MSEPQVHYLTQDEDGCTTISPHRKRHPVPINELPTRDRILVQLLLQLAARDIKNFHPSEQVGWLVYLLEQLESHYDEDEFHRFPPILTALQQDIVLRLQTGSY